MKFAFLIPCLALSVALAAPVRATTSSLWIVGQPIPDNSILGVTDTRNFVSAITNITDVKVTLNISGGWAGDLYAYVQHDSGFAVLLNRVGRTAVSILGNPSSGFSVTLSDAAAADIHLAPDSGALLSGEFQPDGRTADPAVVLNTSARGAMLSSFRGLSSQGNWTIFVADIAAGDEAILQSWSLEITGIPEPSGGTLLLAALGILLSRRRRLLA